MFEKARSSIVFAVALSAIVSAGLSSHLLADDFGWEVNPPDSNWNDFFCWSGTPNEWPGINGNDDSATVDGSVNDNGIFPILNLDLTGANAIGALTIVDGGYVDLGTYTMWVQSDGSQSGTVLIEGIYDSVPATLDVNTGFLDTDYLTINSGGDLEIGGGWVQVDENAAINDGGRVFGYGTFEVSVSAGDIVNNGTIASSGGGTLTIQRTDGSAEFDWDGDGRHGAALVVYAGSTMIIDIPLFPPSGIDPFNGTITVHQAGQFQVNDTWAFGAGTIGIHNQAVMNLNGSSTIGPATVSGGAFDVYRSDTQINVTSIFGSPGFAVIESDMTVHQGSVNVIDEATLQLDGNATFANAANLDLDGAGELIVGGSTEVNQDTIDLDGGGDGDNTITINSGALLRLNVNSIDDDPSASFNGTMNINGGTLHANVDGGWESDGRINLDSASGTATLTGTELTIRGFIPADGLYATGGGQALVSADAVFAANANVHVDANTVLRLTGNLTIEGGDWTGDGTVELDGDTMEVMEPTTMNPAVVDLDGSSTGTDTIILHRPLTLQVDTIDDDGPQVFDGDTIEINQSGQLDVQLNNPNDSWVMNGVLSLNAIFFPNHSTHLAGSDIELRGTVDVSGRSAWSARVDITGNVEIAANSRAKLDGGDLVDTNRIAGGTVTGDGILEATDITGLAGYGTIDAGILFVGPSSRLMAADDVLTINGQISDVGVIGVANADGVLNVTTTWNTNVAEVVQLYGGELTGASVTNDGQIEGFGIVTTSGLKNENIIAAKFGGTLILDSPGNTMDLDGLSNTGSLHAVNGDMEIYEGSLNFNGTIEVGAGRTLFVDGSLNIDDAGPGMLHLTGGTVRTTGSFRLQGNLLAVGAPSVIERTEMGDYIFFYPTSQSTINTDLTVVGPTLIFDGATFAGSGRLIHAMPGAILFIDDGAAIGVTLRNERYMVFGRLAPSGGDVGRLDVSAFEQSPTGFLNVSLGGTELGDFNQLVSAGTVELDGDISVHLVDLGDGLFEPSAGDSFEIISAAGSLTGIFDTEHFFDAVLPEGLLWNINYDTVGNRVILEVLAALAADFDGDGDVDGDDFLTWQSSFMNDDGGDADGDGDTDGDDFLIWQTEFGSVSGSGSTAVPEPAAIALLALLLGGAVMMRRFS